MRNEFAKWEIKTSVFSGRKSQAGNCYAGCVLDGHDALAGRTMEPVTRNSGRTGRGHGSSPCKTTVFRGRVEVTSQPSPIIVSTDYRQSTVFLEFSSPFPARTYDNTEHHGQAWPEPGGRAGQFREGDHGRPCRNMADGSGTSSGPPIARRRFCRGRPTGSHSVSTTERLCPGDMSRWRSSSWRGRSAGLSSRPWQRDAGNPS